MLSKAVMAMSNLPSASPVICATEFGVGSSVTVIPLCSKKPFCCPTKLGQLKPPGKTLTVTFAGACARASAVNKLVVTSSATAPDLDQPDTFMAAPLQGHVIWLQCQREAASNNR